MLALRFSRYMGISLSDFDAQGNKYRFFLQNLTDIHLDPSIQQEFKEPSDPKYLVDFRKYCNTYCIYCSYKFHEPFNCPVITEGKRSRDKEDRRFNKGNADFPVSFRIIYSFFYFTDPFNDFLKVTLPYFNNLLDKSCLKPFY